MSIVSHVKNIKGIHIKKIVAIITFTFCFAEQPVSINEPLLPPTQILDIPLLSLEEPVNSMPEILIQLEEDLPNSLKAISHDTQQWGNYIYYSDGQHFIQDKGLIQHQDGSFSTRYGNVDIHQVPTQNYQKVGNKIYHSIE
ncbi:hypothetical protein CCZ01_00645 [Helicobacter monodelphidis]|nr:hypothetical protein CCZ01_00645 [Helicobacter sp. 15-1451]